MTSKICSNIIILFFFSNLIVAQEIYELNYEYTDEFDYSCQSQLFVKGDESIFKINDVRESGFNQITNGEEGEKIMVLNDELSTFIYSNKIENKVRFVFYQNKELLYKTKNSDYNWNFTGKKKKIGDYKCEEVTLKLNGRKYIIWFTTEIQIIFGPMKLNGLPGTIVSVQEGKGRFKLKLKNIRKSEDINKFNFFKNYFYKKEVLSYSDYESKVIDISTNLKIKQLSIISGLEGDISVDFGDHSDYTKRVIDIPKELLKSLENIN